MMQPQLIVQDFQGAHNADPDGTRARLLRGGSYKRQRIVVVVPAIAPIAPKVYLSHCSLGFPPNNGVVRILAEGMEVGDAYSQAISNILAHPELSQWEFLLTIETDNMPPGDGAVRLCEDMEAHPEFSAIGGLYFCKGPSAPAQLWGDVRDPVVNFRPQVPIPDTIQEVCGLGMGFTMFRLQMFKDARLRRPWFKTTKGESGSGFCTQDLYFFSDCRKYGHRAACDTRIKVGHYDFSGAFGVPDMIW